MLEALSVSLADSALTELISILEAAGIVIDEALQKYVKEDIKKWKWCFDLLQSFEKHGGVHKVAESESLRMVILKFQVVGGVHMRS